jgi:hypothetical protein
VTVKRRYVQTDMGVSCVWSRREFSIEMAIDCLRCPPGV